MIRRLILLSLAFVCYTIIVAQAEKSMFLFEDFQEGIVYYKDGKRFNVKVNYNLISRDFLFLDEQNDNRMLEFAEPEMISLVKVGERNFLYDNREVSEVIQNEPFISVQYRGVIKAKGKNAGYGGRSETAAIDNHSGIYRDGQFHKFDMEASHELGRVTKTYQIVYKKKKQSFINEKSFLKIFSRDSDRIKQYIKENKINFNSIDDVISLVNHAISL